MVIKDVCFVFVHQDGGNDHGKVATIEFLDDEDEDVTFVDLSRYVTREKFDDVKKRLKKMEKVMKLVLVIALVYFVKGYM